MNVYPYAPGPYPDSERLEIIARVPAHAKRVLDIGCWYGALGYRLKSRCPDIFVMGIEPDRDAAAVAVKRLDALVVGSFPLALPEGTAPFDCIVFGDVLEHLRDPAGALRAAAPLLAEGGVVVASLPNVRHLRVITPLLLKGRWDYTDSGVLDRTHLRFFTRATMIELFQHAGYRVLEVVPVGISNSWASRVIAALLSPFPRAGTELRASQYCLVATAC